MSNVHPIFEKALAPFAPPAFEKVLDAYSPPTPAPELRTFDVSFRCRTMHGEGTVQAYTTADAIILGLETLLDPDDSIPDGPMMFVATLNKTHKQLTA